VTVDPSGRFAYVTIGGPDGVAAYTIDQGSGALTAVAGSPFAAGTGPEHVAADPAGNFLYVSNAGSDNVSGYAINQTSGALTTVPHSPFAAGTTPFAIAVWGAQ
jgi:6-phosphogluconolactonase (cycloisomerase 2 family)